MRDRKAFTLVEMLVVLGVLALLAALTTVGLSVLSRSAKTSATRQTLENYRSMLAAYDAATQFKRQPGLWLWNGLPILDPSDPTYNGWGLNFWRSPFHDPANLGGAPAALDGPGTMVLETFEASPTLKYRAGSRAVLNTQLAMNMLLSIPENTQGVQRLPIEQKLELPWTYAAPKMPGPGADGFLENADDQLEDVCYVLGNHVAYRSKTDNVLRRFVCIKAHTSSSSTNPQDDGTANTYWAPEPTMTPLLLDAWGNPIIFVPAGGLKVWTNYGSSAVRQATITSPDGRPFFASAGKDGDFHRGDDNLYSFEN